MKLVNRLIATLELLLVFPAALFMTALFVRNLQPTQYQPAQTARRLVDWFSARPRLGLDVCLILLPLLALIIGVATVIRSWRNDLALRQAAQKLLATIRGNAAPLFIAAATVAAGIILAIVALHVITD